jgi:probable AcnD-accessory protein PrpF
MTQIRMPAAFVRGGTSKGVIVRREDIPEDPELRDQIFLRLLGSPDPYLRQIDGLGGASSSTSKVAIISPSSRDDCDVDYLIGQVDIEHPLVDYSSNCGNLSSAVGPYAIRAGLVTPRDGITEVRIWQENTSRRIIAHVPTLNGQPLEEGDYQIDGVRGTGARIDLEFINPGGSAFGRLLPTGNLTDMVEVPGIGAIETSIVDAAMVMAFVRAVDVGLVGTELRPEIDGDVAVLTRLEAIRGAVAVKLGLCANSTEAALVTPALPKIAFVSPPQSHRVAGGRNIASTQVDLVARGMSMGRLHHAYEVTGSIATAAAAALPGTLVNQIAGFEPSPFRLVRIGHTSGSIEVGIRGRAGEDFEITSATLGRTARLIMEGTAYLPSLNAI